MSLLCTVEVIDSDLASIQMILGRKVQKLSKKVQKGHNSVP